LRFQTFVRLTKLFNAEKYNKWVFITSKLVDILKLYNADCQNL